MGGKFDSNGGAMLSDEDFIREARKILAYDPKTGLITWTCDRRTGKGVGRVHVKAGAEAGTRVAQRGYKRIYVVDRQMYAHRLAWVLHYGEMPPPILDHADGNKGDDRIDNLRPATKAQNAYNSKLQSNNSTGFKGVHLSKKNGRFQANIKGGGKNRFLGYFDTAEEAHAAYCSAAVKYHKDYARFS
jgi:hypothetical protein